MIKIELSETDVRVVNDTSYHVQCEFGLAFKKEERTPGLQAKIDALRSLEKRSFENPAAATWELSEIEAKALKFAVWSMSTMKKYVRKKEAADLLKRIPVEVESFE